MVELRLVFRDGLQARRDGADDTIGQEHTKECADKRGADHGAEHGRRFTDRAHGFDHAKHRGHDAERGKRIGHVLQRAGRTQCLMVMFFELFLHRRFNLVWVFQAHGHHAQGVANEVEGEVVFHDARIALEDGGFRRLLDMLFQRDHAFGFHRLGNEEEQAEQIDVVRMFPFRAGDDLAHLAGDLLQFGNRTADEKRGQCGAQNGQHFMRQRFQHHAERSAGYEKAAEHADKKNTDANKLKHERIRAQQVRESPGPWASVLTGGLKEP